MKRSHAPKQFWHEAPKHLHVNGPRLPAASMLHELMSSFACASTSTIIPVTKPHRTSFVKRIAALTAILIAIAIVAAEAAPITGSIDFGGTVTFDTNSLATATRVNTWNSAFVLQDSGSFSGIPPGTNVTMSAPWIFNPSTATPSLWSVGGFKFDLANSTIVSQTTTFLNITGTGTISGNGFDPTPGTWSFTSSDSNGSPQSSFGFQAQSTAVPESSSVILFGIGLSGAAFLRARTRST
jgi:hypothetical protein